MSVDCSASIYYGYKITKEQLETLSEEVYDKLINHEYHHRFNCYDENEDTIFGFKLYHTEGVIEIINDFNFPRKEMKIARAYTEIFGFSPNCRASTYLCLNVT